MITALGSRLYRLDTLDGIEHIMKVHGEEQDVYEVETIHRFKDHEVRTERKYNKCIFEELMSLGIITPV